MITEQNPPSQRIASRMLARFGVVFIWEAHVAAAAAHGLGQRAVAEDLTEIAEAAEEIWLAKSGRCLFPPVTHSGLVGWLEH